MTQNTKNRRLSTYAYLTIIIAGLLSLLYVGSNIIFPIIFAFFLALLLLPAVKRLQKIGFNHFWSSISTVFVISSVMFAFAYLLYFQGSVLVNEFSEDNKTAQIEPEKVIEDVVDEATETVGLSKSKKRSTSKAIFDKIVSFSGTYLGTFFSGLQETLFFLILSPIYVFFMLYYRMNLFEFIKKRSKEENKEGNLKTLKSIEEMAQKYLRGLVVVIFIVACLNIITLFAFGIQSPIFLGLVSGILIVIPYIGVAIGGAVPTIIALMTKDSYWIAIGVASSYAFVQFLEGNFITPKIIGDSTNLNPLVIIIGIVVLGALGGVLAMIVAVPLFASVKIILENSKNYKEFALLLKNNITKS